MNEVRNGWEKGQECSLIKSRRQGITRGIFSGCLLAIVISGWGPLWLRIVGCLFAWLVYGAVASSSRFVGKL